MPAKASTQRTNGMNSYMTFLSLFGFGRGSATATADSHGIISIYISQIILFNIKNEAKIKGLSNLEIIWGDVEKVGGTKIKDHSIDIIIIANILFQVPDKNNVCAEAKRILKNGGRALVIDWLDSFGGLGPRKEDIFLLSQAKDIFQKNGFLLNKEFDAGDHHYGLIFKKQ